MFFIYLFLAYCLSSSTVVSTYMLFGIYLTYSAILCTFSGSLFSELYEVKFTSTIFKSPSMTLSFIYSLMSNFLVSSLPWFCQGIAFQGRFQERMERIWWGDDEHNSSNRHCKAFFHFIKQETDGFGKDFFLWYFKKLENIRHWHRFIPVRILFICSFVCLFVFLRPCHTSLEILVKLRKNHKHQKNSNASKCAQWHAPFLKWVFCRTWIKPMSNCTLKMSFGVLPPMKYTGYREVSLLLSIL